MELTGWGKYPVVDSTLCKPLSPQSAIQYLTDNPKKSVIARGLGRSYGDSSLAPHVISTAYLNHFLHFDSENGILSCSAGVSLADILSAFVPKGWFLPVTPGTKFVTVGGAIASDVHGKNHHLDGSFSDYVSSFSIALASGEIIQCSRSENTELFHATCGGMGLTGIILEATLKLRPITSATINTATIKAKNLQEALTLFDEHKQATYSVAWIDCLSTRKALGRSLVMLGKHAEQDELTHNKKKTLTIPVDLPNFVLNRYSIQGFNALYYNKVMKCQSKHSIHYELFFYPLDSIHQWNRMYGKNGFTQYQFVLPKDAGLKGMTEVLKRITNSKSGSFLAVLKAFGKGNDNYLSFPMEGYTLVLDFKLDKGLFELLDELDSIVLDYGGKVYLTKDVRMSESMCKQSYPQWEKFMQVRTKYGAEKIFNSLQSQRLGI